MINKNQLKSTRENIIYSKIGHKMADAYHRIADITNNDYTKRNLMNDVFDGLKESPFVSDDEKWIAELAKKHLYNNPYDLHYGRERHYLNDNEAVNLGELYLEDFFSPDAKKEPFDHKLATTVAKTVESTQDPESQLKILHDFGYEYDSYTLERIRERPKETSPMVKTLCAASLNSLPSSPFDKKSLSDEDAVIIGLTALKYFDLAGPYPEVSSKFFSEAMKAVKNEDAKEWLIEERKDCDRAESYRKTGFAPYSVPFDPPKIPVSSPPGPHFQYPLTDYEV